MSTLGNVPAELKGTLGNKSEVGACARVRVAVTDVLLACTCSTLPAPPNDGLGVRVP